MINQTNNVCRMVTNNLARGTPAYRAPEIFCQNGSALSLVDLNAVDIWALGMVLFVIINPDLKYPFQMELERVQTGNCLSVLEGLISKNEKPAHSDHYCMQHAVNCLRLRKLSEYCTRFHPKDRPDAKYIVDVLTNETCQTAETYHSQSTKEPALRMQLARTFLVMGPMAVYFCPWFLAITCCAKMRGQLSPHLKKLPALLRKSSSIPLFNSIPFEIKVGITTYRRLMEFCRNVK